DSFIPDELAGTDTVAYTSGIRRHFHIQTFNWPRLVARSPCARRTGRTGRRFEVHLSQSWIFQDDGDSCSCRPRLQRLRYSDLTPGCTRERDVCATVLREQEHGRSLDA